MLKKLIALLAAALIVFTLFWGMPHAQRQLDMRMYPTPYEEIVAGYSGLYQLDPLLIYAFMRTESSFDPLAQSNVDARGLMQITEITFDWLKPRAGADPDLVFEDLYDPETSIFLGSYYISRCLARYSGDIATAAAAYHSGWGTVDKLLADPAYSSDGKTLDVFPYRQMNHYVAKITRAYAKYQEIYRTEGE